MEYKLYAIYDKDAREYGPLFNAKNDVVASRYVAQMLKGIPSIDSYALYHMGEYDIEHGIVNITTNFVSECSELIEPVEDLE